MTTMSTTAYISLGSNQSGAYGPPAAMLQQALQQLVHIPDIHKVMASPVYMTSPQGPIKEQPWFYNQVACLHCTANLTAGILLDSLLQLELELGRQRREGQAHGGTRCIDLDLLLFGQEVHNGGALTPQNNTLTLPHPHLYKRAFVLVPLQDLVPELIFPHGQSLAAVLQELVYTLENRCITQD